ncbi:MAG TPA: hypothetical protein VN796_06220 [Acidimicrobiales bacterium]|nr:hypothetical protein [Acidimicrobiales bacterium]
MTATVVDDAGDLALHMAARTVAGQCAAPLNALEVAVVLETCGYTSTRASALGADGLLDLGAKVLDLMPLYASPATVAEPEPTKDDHQPNGPLDFARGLVYSSPWLLSIVTTVVAGVSFWSSNVAIPSVANAVTLATAVALLVTAPFIQAFGRRASFYRGLGDQGMIVWITRWTLELGLVVTAFSCLVFYLVRNVVLHAGTPATGRLGLAAGLAIAALQVGLASFYMRGAFLSMGVIMVSAAAVLVWHVEHAGAYLNPVALIVWQLRLVAVMAAVCWVLSAWWLLRVPSTGLSPLWRPSALAVVRSVMPYAAYGLGFFAIVVLPQIVSGGLLQARYSFNPSFTLTSGVALMVLVPLLAQTVATTEHMLHRQFPASLRRRKVAEIDGFRRDMRRYWRAQLALVLGLGVTAGVAVIVGAPRLGTSLSILRDLTRHEGLLAACTAGYVLLGVGLFCCQALFSLSAPMWPLAAAGGGCASMVVASSGATSAGATVAAAVGLVAAAAVFAGVALLGAHRTFSRADLVYYRTF